MLIKWYMSICSKWNYFSPVVPSLGVHLSKGSQINLRSHLMITGRELKKKQSYTAQIYFKETSLMFDFVVEH